MVTYDFYQNTYLGSTIGEKAFASVAARAEEELRRFERLYRVDCPGADSRAMAVCAMAEVLFRWADHRGIRATTVGGVSVSYTDDAPLGGELYRAASVYLTFYRGVGA